MCHQLPTSHSATLNSGVVTVALPASIVSAAIVSRASASGDGPVSTQSNRKRTLMRVL